MDFLTTDFIVSFISLAVVLIILDVDNVIFISILTTELPANEQSKAQKIGFLISIAIRGLLLIGAGYLAQLENPLFTVNFDLVHLKSSITIKDLMVLGGGLFLLYKSTSEIYQKLEGADVVTTLQDKATFNQIMSSIAVLNLVFSIDSVVTAVGMTKSMVIMISAMLLSLTLMFIFQERISQFITAHPSAKILALSFLILIGVFLVIEGVHVVHVPKGYIYFAMAFSLGVELLNIKYRKKGKAVILHDVTSTHTLSDNK